MLLSSSLFTNKLISLQLSKNLLGVSSGKTLVSLENSLLKPKYVSLSSSFVKEENGRLERHLSQVKQDLFFEPLIYSLLDRLTHFW